MHTIHILVKGKVQGVFYRATAKHVAMDLGLKGWVKNTEDGDVEMTVTGEQKTIDDFVQWCHKGPERARVSEVVCSIVGTQPFSKFSVLR